MCFNLEYQWISALFKAMAHLKSMITANVAAEKPVQSAAMTRYSVPLQQSLATRSAVQQGQEFQSSVWQRHSIYAQKCIHAPFVFMILETSHLCKQPLLNCVNLHFCLDNRAPSSGSTILVKRLRRQKNQTGFQAGSILTVWQTSWKSTGLLVKGFSATSLVI